jgi:hypothetical protein
MVQIYHCDFGLSVWWESVSVGVRVTYRKMKNEGVERAPPPSPLPVSLPLVVLSFLKPMHRRVWMMIPTSIVMVLANGGNLVLPYLKTSRKLHLVSWGNQEY